MTPLPEPARSRSGETELPAHRVGREGEAIAAQWLRRHGYRVELRRLRVRDGEIDVLVRRAIVPAWLPAVFHSAVHALTTRALPVPWSVNWQWIAVEVKAGTGAAPPELAADPARIARLELALQRLAPNLRPPPSGLRVDVLAVWLPKNATQPRVAHFPGRGFDPPARYGAGHAPRPGRLRDSS